MCLLPFSLAHLEYMIQATYEVAKGRIFILGDFNSVSDSALERLGATFGTPVTLVGWMSTHGFRDVWHFHHPDNSEYSCYSETHKTLSRIDTILTEGEGMDLVRAVSYLPRALSDHSPMLLELNLGPKPGIRHWRMEASWLKEDYVQIKCAEGVKHFWAENGNSGSSLLQWEAFKATLRGVFIAEVHGFKKQLASTVQLKETEVTLAEAEYVRDPTSERLLTLRERTREYRTVLMDRTTKLNLAQRRRIFEFGDKNSRLLAYLARSDYVPVYVQSVYDKQGVEVADTADVLKTFAQFYEELYRSCAPTGTRGVGNLPDRH